MYLFRKAVLIIHGFAGGTYDEESLFFKLQSDIEFDVYNFTLPGHATNLSNDVKYTDWVNSANEKIEKLISYGYKKIYVIGHSMGGLLATEVAIKYKEVKKLVLVAPAFEYLSLTDDSTLTKAIKYGPDIIKTYKGKEVFSRFLKVSFEQLKEFEKIVELSSANPEKINVPTLIIQGLDDKLVPPESSLNIYNNMKCLKWLINIEGVTHDVFYSDKVDIINEEISKFLKSSKYSAESIRKW